jgi:hypothetical protein
MMNRNWAKGIGGAMAMSGALALAASGAGATTTGASGASGATPNSFTQAQQQLEKQLANRSTQLQHLVADVAGAKSLTTADANILNARLSTEAASITALIAKVPTDTKRAELNSDRAAMLKDNRVYAVMTPQVFVTIGADTAGAQAAVLTGNEPALASEVASIGVGMPGYRNALDHYNNYVSRLNHITDNMTEVVTKVLAQTPQGYPGNTHVFVSANHTVLNANVGIAYASYDASVIALASGGYTGS